MKKIISFICMTMLLLSMSMTVLAGSIPEDLMHSDDAQIFFAEVVAYHPNSIEVSPVKVIKGDVETGVKLIYEDPNPMGNLDVKAGNVYLFTYFDENNPTDIFEVTSYDTSTLKLKNVSGDMWERFQKYLNDGKYEKAEQDRINKINATLTEVGEEITLEALTEILKEDCSKVEISLFGGQQSYEIDVQDFYRMASKIRCVDVENTLVADQDDGIVIRCYEVSKFKEIVIWDNCKVAGSRVAMNSAPTGDYIIKAEDYQKLASLLPEEAQPNLPPLKSLYANFIYWFIYNSTTAYIIGTILLVVITGIIIYAVGKKKKSK